MILLLLVGPAIFAALYSSFLLISIERVTGTTPDPPPTSVAVSTADDQRTAIEDVPCTEENIWRLIGLLRIKPGFIGDYRVVAAKRLGDCGAAVALPDLERMSRTEDPKVQAAALEAIAKIKKAN